MANKGNLCITVGRCQVNTYIVYQTPRTAESHLLKRQPTNNYPSRKSINMDNSFPVLFSRVTRGIVIGAIYAAVIDESTGGDTCITLQGLLDLNI